MINKIYDAFIADTLLNNKVQGRIKFYEYPAPGAVTGPCIIIDPLDTPIPGDYADNQWLTDDYLFQIEVWSKSLSDTKLIAEQIRKIMWDLNFGQGGGVDEYDKDYGVFRDARRYRGKVYVNLKEG
ncbi:hypothetical protein SLL00_03485 [Metabacillus indicus]|uniref:hypothetical protein n=1 Tax=Metabacillus indicus TaxID=246786 RepID=UPI002A08B2DA|nr:hypothetical protein [Metabacillus indicus]MDX8288836.1 hypothetical protein [Metabacillus indicus]